MAYLLTTPGLETAAATFKTNTHKKKKEKG